jgi:hypothetical protein
MEIYTFNPSGGVVVGCGCVPVVLDKYYYVKFGPRDVVYVKKEAEGGVLEKLVIKNYVINDLFQPVYKDTLNGLWLEYELVSYDVAIQLAKYYYNHMFDQYNKCPCNC